MRLSEATEDALAACLDAVAEPLRWQTALQQLGESLGAESCTFCSRDLQQLSALVMPVSTGHDGFADRWLRNEPHAPDPHFVLGRRRVHKGQPVVLEHDLSTEDERRSLLYYQETARPEGREWWAIARFMVGQSSWCFPVYRGARHGPFTPDEARLLAMLGPRLAPIVSMAEKFAAFQVSSGLLGLEQARCAAFVIDARGMVTNMNSRAERLLGADLTLSRRRLVAADAGSNRALRQLVDRGTAARFADEVPTAPVVISCGGEPAYLAEAVPMRAMLSAFFSTARILLLVTPLKEKAAPADSLLRQAFGLTPAEARLARLLAAGSDLEDAVAQLGIRMSTARSQLRAVFDKTHTRRQAELLGLLARLGAGRC